MEVFSIYDITWKLKQSLEGVGTLKEKKKKKKALESNEKGVKVARIRFQ